MFHDMVAYVPQSFSECKSALDYLVQMQHYELPTRLLDVTTNPLVALYFACESAGDAIARIEAGAMKGGEAFYIFRSKERVNFTRMDPHDQDAFMTIANMLGALAGASDATPTCVEKLAPVLISDIFSQNPEAREQPIVLQNPLLWLLLKLVLRQGIKTESFICSQYPMIE